MGFGFDDGEVDALYTKAVNIVIEQQKVSTSYIQRYLQIGYNRAARIVEKMEEEGLQLDGSMSAYFDSLLVVSRSMLSRWDHFPETATAD